MQIAGSEETEIFRNEGIPSRETKTQKEKHGPKVIRDSEF
jgi:hypothetical protein